MYPLVTIAIPTYKRLHYLKEAVLSSLNQTYSNIEIVIVQDPTPEGLDPDIKKWASHFVQEHCDMKYFFNKENKGLSGNWNVCASLASGEYMMIIGDDDKLLPDTVEKLIRAILPDNHVAFSNHYLIDEKGKRLEKESIAHTKQFNRAELTTGKIENPEKVIWQNAVPISAALLRTEDVRKLSFKEDLNTPEIEFYLRLAKGGGSFFYIPDYTMEYRVHKDSATSNGLKVHYLLNYLISLEAGNGNETYKNNFISQLIIPAVNLYLKEGQMKKAKDLYKSRYYSFSLKLSWKGILQSFCFLLPSRLCLLIIRFIQTLKSKNNRRSGAANFVRI